MKPLSIKKANTLAQAHAQIDELVDLVRDLQAQVQLLTEQLGKSSRNSSRPPSSDSTYQRTKRHKKKPTGRHKGAQPGHPKYSRELCPEEAVDDFHRYFPQAECACGGKILIDPKPARRHQIFDLPMPTYAVTEHQVFSGQCQHCKQHYQGDLPDSVPRGQLGSGLISWIVLMSGQFHLSVRNIQQLLLEQWQLNFSIGAICEAQGKANSWLDIHYQDIAHQVRSSELAHADETTHWHLGKQAWLWVLASSTVVFFMTHGSRGKKAADQLLGHFKGYLVSDQYVGYDRFDTFKRQLCWSHLIRKFTAMSERAGKGGNIGKRLLLIAHGVIRTHHRFEKQQITEPIYYRRIRRLQWSFEEILEKGSRLRVDSRTANQCRYLLPDVHMCWTFLQDHRIPLTNNLAERVLRPYVIWRKLSYSTQSESGNGFRPRVLSVIETLKLQGLSTYAFLRQSCAQYMHEGCVTSRLDCSEKKLIQSL